MRTFKHLIFAILIAFAIVAHADVVQVQITTPGLTGATGVLAFDLVGNGLPANTVAVSNFSSDGTLGSPLPASGGVAGALPGNVTLNDAGNFFNEYLSGFTFGSTLSFTLSLSNLASSTAQPDSFSFFLLDPTASYSLVNTSDPTGANSLFAVDMTGNGLSGLSTFTGDGFSVSVLSGVPEPGSIALLGSGLGLLWLRRSSLRTMFALLLAAICGIGLLAPPATSAQTFSTRVLFDNNTKRPDGGYFYVNYVPITLEGSIAAFASFDDSVWTMNVDTGTFVKIADLNTAVPGGVGNFSSFFDTFTDSLAVEPKIKNGTVVFFGKDATGGLGVYSAPASGGPIQLVANYRTLLPDGNSFATMPIQDISFDGHRVLLMGAGAAYIVNVDGTNLFTFANQNTNLNSNSWAFPMGAPTHTATLDGNRVSGMAMNVFDLYNAFNAVLTVPAATLPPDGPPFSSTPHRNNFNSLQPLPGDPETGYHTRLGTVTLQGDTVYFAADNSYGYYYGLFAARASATSSAGGPAVLLLNNLQGISTARSFFNDYSVDHGNIVVFANSGTGSGDYYLLSGGARYQMTQNAFGNTLARLSYNNGRLAYTANGWWGAAARLVSPTSCGTTLTSQIKVAQGGFRYDRASQQFVQTVTLKNTGSTAVNGPVTLYVKNLSSNAQLANLVAVSACVSPGSPYVTAVTAGNSLAPGASVSVQLDFSDPGMGLITYSPLISAGAGLP